MGRGIRIKCQNCSAKQDFLLGVGMEYSSLETVIGDLPPKYREDVQKILQDHEVLHRDFEWRIYMCGNCNRLYDRFWVKIAYDGDQTYETTYHCEKCGERLYQFRDFARIKDLPCSHCGKRTLAVEDKFLWD